jgi:hypothetical protein
MAASVGFLIHRTHNPYLTIPDEGSVILTSKEASHTLARRPRRYFVPVIIACLVLRIEAFHQTTTQLQCSKPGIEVRPTLYLP